MQEDDLDDDEPFEDALKRLQSNLNEEEEAAMASAELNREDRKIVPVPEEEKVCSSLYLLYALLFYLYGALDFPPSQIRKILNHSLH